MSENIYISIYIVGINGRGNLDNRCGNLDVMDGLILKKSIGSPF
jgi:hypothetical protein